MKTVQFSTVAGLSFAVTGVPESVEEFDSNSHPGCCLQNAIANILYRVAASQGRKKLVSIIERETGIPINRKTTEDGNPGAPTEAEGAYCKRVMASLGVEDLSQFQDIVNQELVIEWDAKQAVRQAKSGSGKLPKKWQQMGEAVVADGNAESVAARLQAHLSTDSPFTVEATAESIGWALREVDVRANAAAKKHAEEQRKAIFASA